ncbi:MAG: rubredoxin [Actinomycetota bacterium]
MPGARCPRTRWQEVPDGWCCPDCGVRDKADFVAVPDHIS